MYLFEPVLRVLSQLLTAHWTCLTLQRPLLQTGLMVDMSTNCLLDEVGHLEGLKADSTVITS